MDIKKHINDILLDHNSGLIDIDESTNKLYELFQGIKYSEREIDFIYLVGVLNVSGMDGLHNEIQRLKEIGKEPHDIILGIR